MVDEFRAGPARQAVHATRAVAGIIEIVHDREWQAITVGEPFDGRAGRVRYDSHDRLVRLAMRLGLDLAREQGGRIGDLKQALKTRAGGGDEAC